MLMPAISNVFALLLLLAPFSLAARRSPAQTASASAYDKAIFGRTLPPDQLAFLRQLAADASKSPVASGQVIEDKQFRKILKNVLPDCTFHYGSDMPLSKAVDTVFERSTEPAAIRAGRYLTLSGHSGPYLAGRAFLWFDLDEGVALGAFFFHPTNGEPTPSVNVFSREIRDPDIALGQLPPAFAEDLAVWSGDMSIPVVTARYFLNGSNKKLLLEHDEDFCKPASSAQEFNGDCDQANADAADMDVTAASFLEATHYATNATAWMISEDDRLFVQTRVSTCGGAFACRIRLDRERIHILSKGPVRRR